MLYIIQQLALTFYGPEARPVEAPFNYRILLPWFGYSGYKLSIIAASVAAARRDMVRADPHPDRPRHARHAI